MPYSVEVREKAMELRKGGMSLDKIVAQLDGVGRSTVYRWITPGAMERACEYAKKYNEEHPEVRKRYKEENKDRIAARERERYLKDRDRILAYNAAYRANNPEKRSETCRNYRKAHLRERAEDCRARRAITNDFRVIEKHEYDKMLHEQNGLCFYCGKKMSTDGDYHSLDYYNIEHINPICNGGWHSIDNIVIACHWCNMSKGHRLVEEWMPEIMEKIEAHPRLKYDVEENNKRWLI